MTPDDLVLQLKQRAQEMDEAAAALRDAVETLTSLSRELASANQKWRSYEHEYILPTFKWAEELGFDLHERVMHTTGKNCVVLFFDELRLRLGRLVAERSAMEELLCQAAPLQWAATTDLDGARAWEKRVTDWLEASREFDGVLQAMTRMTPGTYQQLTGQNRTTVDCDGNVLRFTDTVENPTTERRATVGTVYEDGTFDVCDSETGWVYARQGSWQWRKSKPVNATAYLVVHVDTTEFPPRFVGADIYSERSPTGATCPGRWSAVVAEGTGTDFADARENLIQDLSREPYQSVFGWALRILRGNE